MIDLYQREDTEYYKVKGGFSNEKSKISKSIITFCGILINASFTELRNGRKFGRKNTHNNASVQT